MAVILFNYNLQKIIINYVFTCTMTNIVRLDINFCPIRSFQSQIYKADLS
jgi:hypothetical protein